MSTGSTSPRRFVPAFLLSLVLLPALVACGDDTPVSNRDPEDDAVAAIQQTLRQRARAITSANSVAFRRTYNQRDGAFAAEQADYFDNLGQLPLDTLRFDVEPTSLRPDGDGYWAVVEIRLELLNYDVAPVITRDRWRFAPTSDQRRWVLTSTTDADWEARSGPQPQPWDLDDIEVRDGAGVLGIFDSTTVASADEILDSVSENRFAVRSVLPLDIEDPGGVVVYVLSDPAYLESVDSLPVSDPDRLDGVTVPVPRDADGVDGQVSSYRIVLNPGVVDQDEEALDRLVRHELTHVAVGERERGVPLWFREGLAEYVSVQPIAPSERRLQTDALNLAAAGVSDLPTDEEFAGGDAEGWYAVSWWVCEYIAATFGEEALWALLDGLADGADQQAVISEQLGITTSDLVQGGIDLMRNTYG